jgi:hypothetical protein
MENDERDKIARRREIVKISYDLAWKENNDLYKNGNDKGTEYYIFPNQMSDATKIVDIFYNNRDIIVISITKRTKVGMDGLMIQLAYILSTHPDDNFIINYKNVKFITGMSNKSWEDDFKEKVPSCFNKDNIYHHGQLDNCSLTDLKNGLIIIDEIDSGDKEGQRLHTRLRDSGITDINLLKKNNTRLIVVSATMLTQLMDTNQVELKQSLNGWNKL